MPPRIRTRVSKAQKENIGTGNKVKSKEVTTRTKATRRALADKTNSASDDNSFEVKEKKTVVKSSNADSKQIAESAEYNDDVRPRRDRRLPNWFVENGVLTTLCSTKNNVASRNTSTNRAKATTTKSTKPSVQTVSPDKSIFETSSFGLNLKAESSLVVCRPRRICRLPSRFNDHSISPNKFIPLQPQNASTPIQQNKVKVLSTDKHFANKENKRPEKQITATLPPRLAKTNATNKGLTIEISADTNNNAKPNSTKTKKSDPLSPKRVRRQRNTIKSYNNECAALPLPATKKINHKVINDANLKRVITKMPEIKMLGCNKNSPKSKKKNQDIYEFTFDPDEEPQPQKKKRKKPAIKKAPKVTKTIKTTYDQNISKALAALKDVLKNCKDKQPNTNLPQIQETDEYDEPNNLVAKISTVSGINKTLTHTGGYSSIRIEDIAADIEATADNDVDLNYSPVNSPHPKLSVTPNAIHEPREIPEIRVGDTDPLNLQENISFFDDIPVANSSMNTSVRHPLASPWRVEFNDLPIKWHVNTYVKPNMTPAVECSFIGSEESNKKKHVYTTMVPEDNDPLPMIQEVTEKKAQIQKRRYGSPSKVNPCDISHISGHTSTKKAESKTLTKDSVSDHNTSEEVSTNNCDLSNEKQKLKEKRNTRKRKNYENTSDKLSKSPEKQKTKDCTYFGFDESEDQENLSAIKAKENARCLRLRPRRVLQEINGPATAVLPVAVKSKITTSSEAVKKAFEGLKSAEDAPVFLENTEVNITNNDDLSLNDDSQSVHLFEDIEVVHYVKPTRKSYGNNKKVTFCQQSTSANDLQDNAQNNDDDEFYDDECSDDNDCGDFTFEFPNIKEKKKVKKKKPKKVISKKEEKEAEEWAAGFNSICDEIEEFPLVVE